MIMYTKIKFTQDNFEILKNNFDEKNNVADFLI